MKTVTSLVVWVLLVSSVTRVHAQKKGAAGAGSPASSSSSSSASSTPAASSSAAIESQMLAFGALDLIANRVATTTCSTIYPPGFKGERTLVIFDQTAFANLAAYQGFVANALALKSLYFSLLTSNESTIDPFSDATSLLSAIAVASNSESSGSIVIPDSAMAVAITRELKSDPSNTCHAKVEYLTVIYPPLFGVSSASHLNLHS